MFFIFIFFFFSQGNLLDSDFVSRSLVIENGTDLELEKYRI